MAEGVEFERTDRLVCGFGRSFKPLYIIFFK